MIGADARPEMNSDSAVTTRPLLSVEQLVVRYGAVEALRGIDVTVGHGQAVAVVGPNGAGKTTFLRAISGLVRPTRGRVVLDGATVAGKPPYRIARSGLVHVPEGRGMIDPLTGLDACPIAKNGDGAIVGMIPTCPHFESDGVTESPLAGQAVIANLYPGLYEVVAAPAADRIARGEEWLQTNTLDGTKSHEAFIKPNEPGYFQEFGPGGFHVVIGFANPKIINDRKAALCATQSCNATLNVQITSTRMSRTPDQRLYSSGNYDAYGFTQCYLSIGPPDGADFAFEKCQSDGTVTFTGMPVGNFRLTVFDQWNDLLLDGLVHPLKIDGNTAVKEFPVTQWRSNLYTRTFIDLNGDGVSQDTEPGLPLASTNIRYRDGSFGFFNNTDLNGFAGFNEVFPFMNWLVAETDTTRYKLTGVHSVYDAGGPADAGHGRLAIAPDDLLIQSAHCTPLVS